MLMLLKEGWGWSVIAGNGNSNEGWKLKVAENDNQQVNHYL